ncbi:MAG: hypothetical protein HY782_28310 [Chloroflexi bacterium]|nr:hypothetical protein [Chloroflexota bacterium]
MPRRIKSKPQKRDWRWYASFALNAAVALSMVLGSVLLFTGGAIAPRPSVPTISVPTEAPGASQPTVAPTPTPPEPTPTPKASAGVIAIAVAGDSRDGVVV